MECSGHQPLKCGGRIAISHLHYLALESAKFCRECRFSNILWSYACLVISLCHIQLGSEFSLCYIMTYCVLIWERHYSFHVFLLCCCRSNKVLNVPFFYGRHSIGVTCFVAAGTHHPAVVYHSIFQASSERNASGHLGNLCLSCFDSSMKGISCDTSQNGGNFNGSGPNKSLYFSAISSHN